MKKGVGHEKTMTTKMAKKSNPGEEVRGGVRHVV